MPSLNQHDLQGLLDNIKESDPSLLAFMRHNPAGYKSSSSSTTTTSTTQEREKRINISISISNR